MKSLWIACAFVLATSALTPPGTAADFFAGDCRGGTCRPAERLVIRESVAVREVHRSGGFCAGGSCRPAGGKLRAAVGRLLGR